MSPVPEQWTTRGQFTPASVPGQGEVRWPPSSQSAAGNGVGRLTDSAMPQLDAVQNPRLMATELGRLLGEPTEVLEIAVVRYKPGRRCTCRYDLRLGPTGSSRSARLYAKTFASERGATVFELTRAITAARACGPTVWLPEPVGYLPHLKLVVQQDVPGTATAPALIDGDEQLAGRIADALHALHHSGLELRRQHGLGNELDPLAERIEQLCAGRPSLAPMAHHCLRLVRVGSAGIIGWRWRPTHRDFYHDQVLASAGGLSVLDFDDAAMSEPAVDVANFCAHLRLLSLQTIGRADGLARITTAFTDRYQKLDPGLDRGLVRLLEGATLLRLAEIHRPRSRGAWLAARLLGESARLLHSTQRSHVSQAQ